MDKYTQLQLDAIADELTNITDRLEALKREDEISDKIESIKEHLGKALYELNHIND